MPHYRATLAQNVREYLYLDFEAPDDNAARARIKTLNFDDAEEMPNSRDIPENSDRVVMLDRHEGGVPHKFTVIEDRIILDI